LFFVLFRFSNLRKEKAEMVAFLLCFPENRPETAVTPTSLFFILERSCGRTRVALKAMLLPFVTKILSG